MEADVPDCSLECTLWCSLSAAPPLNINELFSMGMEGSGDSYDFLAGSFCIF